MSEISQGLVISGVGILITFSALGILIGLIAGLKAIFPTRANQESGIDPVYQDEGSVPIEREKLLRQAAGVGVSVLMKKMNQTNQGSLGKLLEDPVGAWWEKGLDRVHGKE